jgi:cytidylate kinase
MPDNLFIPSVDLRIQALEEYNRKQKENAAARLKKEKVRPCITLSREYGCTGYPAAETLREIMMERTGEPWVLVDTDVLEEVARRHNLSADILRTLGEHDRILAQVLATFSPHWKSNHDYFKPLASHIVALAEQGNVIILEMGGAIMTRHMEHSWHFRIFASDKFKCAKLAKRWHSEVEDAEKLMHKQQKLRDNFTRDFLNRENSDPLLYDLQFNNGRCPHQKIARVIADFIEI